MKSTFVALFVAFVSCLTGAASAQASARSVECESKQAVGPHWSDWGYVRLVENNDTDQWAVSFAVEKGDRLVSRVPESEIKAAQVDGDFGENLAKLRFTLKKDGTKIGEFTAKGRNIKLNEPKLNASFEHCVFTDEDGKETQF